MYRCWKRFTGRVQTGVLVAHERSGSTTYRCYMDSLQKPDQFVSIYTDGRSIY